MNRKGFSLVEMMLAVLIVGVTVGAIFRLLAPLVTFFHSSLTRQRSNSEARTCMNMISMAMRGGIATSVVITTPAPSPPGVAWSRIDFTLPTALPNGTTAYTFELVNGTVQMQAYPSPRPLQPRVLASNVTKLLFAPVDVRDPSVFDVSLRIDAPFDNSGRPERVSTIQIDQQIHMLVNY